MSNTPRRRRFLQLTGTGTVAALAGCVDSLPNLGTGNGQEGNENDHEEMYTVIVQPDQEAVQELRTGVMSGELGQEEAQEEFAQLVDDAGEEFRSYVEDDDQITLEEQDPEIGLYLVDGSAESVLGTLDVDGVSQVRSGGEYQEILDQQAAAEEQAAQEQPPQDGEQPEGEGTNETEE